MSDLIYIAGLAEKLGRSEAAIRAAVHRDKLRGSRKKALPPAIKVAGKVAWRRQDVESWLEEKVQAARGAA